MGKQYNKVIKRRRARAYEQRIKERAKAHLAASPKKRR